MSYISEQQSFTPYSPSYRRAIELIGRKWSGAIIRALLAGATQFSELGDVIPGVSDRLISVRLKELEAEGIVERIVIPEKPVRIQYRLTAKGESLAEIVHLISDWAEMWGARTQALPTKDAD
jgi:DNA-binding HxlR family transcriptional regulator